MRRLTEDRLEKEAREREKSLGAGKRIKARGRKPAGRATEEPGLSFKPPEPEKPAFGAGREEQHLKEELGIGAEKPAGKEPGLEGKDETFDELERLSSETEKPAAGGTGEDEFSMEGFSTDLGGKPRKKKETK